jgi:hypothetical protein
MDDRQAGGSYGTRTAQVYPPKICHAIAQCFREVLKNDMGDVQKLCFDDELK